MPSGNTGWFKMSSLPSRNSEYNRETRADFRREEMSKAAYDSCQMRGEKTNDF